MIHLALWCRQAVVAPIRPITWEPPCARVQPSKDKRKEKKRISSNQLYFKRKLMLSKHTSMFSDPQALPTKNYRQVTIGGKISSFYK